MRVIADEDKCIGAGQCVRAAAAVFDQDEDTGLVVVLNDEPSEDVRSAVNAAVRLCPTHALRMES